MKEMVSRINQYLDDITSSYKDGKVKEALRYSLLAPGKRVRPVLFLLTLKSSSLPYESYLDIACAIEMIHTYSLIHDDLPGMDNDDLRRGRPTCHKQFDEATAILAGDALLNQACLLILNSNVSDELKVKLTTCLYQHSGINGMIYGQQQDLYYENKQATIEQLEDIHVHKTGCLLTVPFLMAGMIIKSKDLDIYKKIGYHLGMAFQIQDDILDVVATTEQLGKKVGSDKQNNKSTYVSLKGIEQSEKDVKYHFETLLNLLDQLQLENKELKDYFNVLIKRVS